MRNTTGDRNNADATIMKNTYADARPIPVMTARINTLIAMCASYTARSVSVDVCNHDRQS